MHVNEASLPWEGCAASRTGVKKGLLDEPGGACKRSRGKGGKGGVLGLGLEQPNPYTWRTCGPTFGRIPEIHVRSAAPSGVNG